MKKREKKKIVPLNNRNSVHINSAPYRIRLPSSSYNCFCFVSRLDGKLHFIQTLSAPFVCIYTLYPRSLNSRQMKCETWFVISKVIQCLFFFFWFYNLFFFFLSKLIQLQTSGRIWSVCDSRAAVFATLHVRLAFQPQTSEIFKYNIISFSAKKVHKFIINHSILTSSHIQFRSELLRGFFRK